MTPFYTSRKFLNIIISKKLNNLLVIFRTKKKFNKKFKMPLFRILFINILFIPVYLNSLSAQQYNIEFKHIGQQKGLSNDHITDILQDDLGYMWIATKRGLNRYDGNQMLNFRSEPISSTSIVDLERNKYGGIWILTKKDLTLYHEGTFETKILFNDTNISIDHMKIIGDENWFFTNKGVYTYARKKGVFNKIQIVPNTNFKYSFINNTGISTALLDPEKNQLWICTANKGVYTKESGKPLKPYLLEPNESQSINNIIVKKILRDNQGNMWFASTRGLYYKNKNEISPKKIKLENNEIRDITIDYEGNIWCSISDLGIILLSSNGKIIEQFDAENNQHKTGLSSGFINKITFDDHNNLWLGHEETGIDFLATRFSKKIAYYKNLTNEVGYMTTKVKRILPLENKKILIAYESFNNPNISGLNVISTGEGNFFSQPKKIQKIILEQDDLDITELIAIENKISVTTYEYIYTFNDALLNPTKPIININPVSAKFNEFVNFNYNSENNYWLLGNNLRTYDILKQQEKIYIKDLNLDRFFIDDEGLMWGAASNNGLIIIDINKKEKIQEYISDPLNETSISNNNINCIYKDSNGSIWIGTDFGLNKIKNLPVKYNQHDTFDIKNGLKNLKFERYKLKNGLSGNSIKSIVEDNHKRLWLATDEGISMINLTTNNIFKLGTEEGIQNGAFIINSFAQSNDGTLYFGGEKGLNFFHPDSIHFNKKIIPIFINGLKVMNKKIETGLKYGDRIILKKDIEYTSKIILSYQEELIDFNFIGVDFEKSSDLEYYYKLEGYDNDWIQTKNTQSATYTKVPPGKYTFKVKAFTADNYWTNEAELQIVIDSPFWTSWWFLLIILQIPIWLTVLYVKLRLSSIKKQKTKLEQIVNDRTQDLEKANFGLQKQKGEIQSQRDQLQQLNSKIKQSNELKLKFFTNISHELKTPLTLILAPIEQLIKSQGLTPQIQKTHALIYENGHRLNQLINQLLQFRKIETGNLELRAREGDIIGSIVNLSDHFLEYAKATNINYQLMCSHDPIITWYDEDKLYKIISNLLSNAFKYTPNGGDVLLNVFCVSDQAHEKYIKIEVSDTGIGVEKSQLINIFDRFYQSNDINYEAEGTGIGLSLTQSLVKLHKGKIEVESELGKGSKFIVTIPLGESYLEQHEKHHSADKALNYLKEKSKISSLKYQKYELKTTQFNIEKHTILIVEDNFDLCELMYSLLKENYNIEIANNGKEGLEILKNNESIDLIISDIMMPIMDGISFCKMVKSNISTSHLPVLLLTAKYGEESEIEGLKSGADDYITKPFNEKILNFKIVNTLAYRDSLRNQYQQKISIEPSEITTTSRDQEFIDKAIKVVEENMSNDKFNIKEFSSELAMSPSTLLRKIKAITGEPSDGFIRKIRLKRAAQLLQKSQLLITEICYSIGFSSQKHFSTAFKKQFDLSPSEYKKKYSEHKVSKIL
ncbi:MAG: two-component regulator propeller domain-containing protein [Alphaproteobacteria bacterium]|jgi:signal transduction histidine kinase/DNA-binding response OmpR family regulator/ligand-binding sensor domain-containing protein